MHSQGGQLIKTKNSNSSESSGAALGDNRKSRYLSGLQKPAGLISLIVFFTFTLVGCVNSEDAQMNEEITTPSPSNPSLETPVNPAWMKYVAFEVLELSISKTPCGTADGSLTYTLKATNLTDIKIVGINGGVVAVRSAIGSELLGVSFDEVVLGGAETREFRPSDGDEGCLEFPQARNQDIFAIENLEQEYNFEYGVNSIVFEDGQELDFSMWDDPVFLP